MTTVREARTAANSLAVTLCSIGSGGLNVEDKQLVYKAEQLLDEARVILFAVKAQDES